jgi:histidinol dehydrogenase
MQGPGDHRSDREAGRLVYPVVSRRSGGLSLGVNLFPDAKVCSFDCPYCEIFLRAEPGSDPNAGFSIVALEEELEDFLDRRYFEAWAPDPIRDICISGNGEPTMSPVLEDALRLCAGVRRSRADLLGSSSLVLITNSTGFLDPSTCAVLEGACGSEGLVVWAKLDAGSEAPFRVMSGTDIGLRRIASGLLSFARRSPVVIQTMLCEVDSAKPSEGEVADYSRLLSRLVDEGARIDEVHLYTFARPSPAGRCGAISDDALALAAAAVAGATGLRVRAFGLGAELRDDGSRRHD